MTFTSRILLYNYSLLRLNKRATNFIQKLPLREMQYTRSNYPKSNFVPQENKLSTVKEFGKYKSAVRNFDPNATTTFHKIDLLPIIKNAHNLPTGLLIATFHKLRFVYYMNKGRKNFNHELNHLTKSKVFHDFCKVLEKELPKLQPFYLGVLLDLVHFNISPKSVMMRKLFVLILDNIHFFPPLDLIDLYCQLQQQYFKDIPECKSILEGCEKYFEKHLEEEMSHFYDIRNMFYLISEEVLPLKVRKILTEKCLSLIESGQYNLTVIPSFFNIAFEQPIMSFYKTELLDKFKKILENYRLPKVQVKLSKVYKNCVTKYDSLYDEEICKMFAENVTFTSTDSSFITTLSNLRGIGYYDQKATDRALDLLISVNPCNLSPHLMLNLASILVDTCAHEANNPHWGKIKSQLESYNAAEKFNWTSNFYLFCEILTFLKCDTTSFFSSIFENYEKSTEISNKSSRLVLRSHHVCRKYFPDSNLGLSKKSLKSCLENSIYENDFYVNSYVNQFFGSSDYVLENCFTPDYQFFPIVAFLGPDNKPIDLSEYKTKDKNFSVTVNIEHIKRPPGTKVLVFLKYLKSQPIKFRNAPITSGFLKMFLKPYEGLNFNFILLPQKYFFLEDDEKFRYLTSEVNKVIENSDTASVRNENCFKK